MLTDDACYRALSSRDARFDGWFFVGVLTTGIYCRPSCPAMTPKRANVRFLPTAAAAHEAGFRACKRCRPDAAPGSPEWNVRADLVGRAMRHIADGVVDREGVAGLAQRLGYSERQVHRQLDRRSRSRADRARPRAAFADRARCCSKPPNCRSPMLPSPPASPAFASSTTPCGRCLRSRRRNFAPAAKCGAQAHGAADDRRTQPAAAIPPSICAVVHLRLSCSPSRRRSRSG